MSGGIVSDFAALADIGRDADGGWTRPAYSPEEATAHRWFADRAIATGMEVRQDAFGNSTARLPGARDLPAIAVGSHLDTVTRGGAFDGALGVLAGLEIARRVAASPRLRPLEVIAFRDEEGRFGALTGSRAMMGDLPDDAFDRMKSADGLRLADALAHAGLTPATPQAARRDPAEIAAWLELHIEQGPVLEAAGIPVGIVTAIAGQERLSVRFSGSAGHAGTTPMAMRRDAFAAAARFADRFRDLILTEGQGSARGTIGIVRVTPNQGNVIPSEVTLGLEIRDIQAPLVSRLAEATRILAARTAQDMQVVSVIRTVHVSPPVPMAPALVTRLEEAAAAGAVPTMRLPSGANHDAGILGAHLPAAMVFVPSRDGLSHVPEEHTDWPPILAAVGVMTTAVLDLLSSESL